MNRLAQNAKSLNLQDIRNFLGIGLFWFYYCYGFDPVSLVNLVPVGVYYFADHMANIITDLFGIM